MEEIMEKLAVKVSSVLLVDVDTWRATVLECTTEKETSGGQSQLPDADTSGGMHLLALKNVSGNIGRIAEYWGIYDLEAEEGEKYPRAAKDHLRGAKCLAMNKEWLKNYVIEEFDVS